MNENKGRVKTTLDKSKVARFFEKQGFFIVLFLCVAIIGVTAYFTFSGGDNVAEVPEQSDEQVQQIPGGGLSQQAKATSPPPTIAPTASPVITPTPTPTPPNVNPNPNRNTALLGLPVAGEITLNFAKNSLVYSKTLKQWTSHMGIDLKANEGDDVKAAMAGTVESAAKDDLLGYTIVIKHANDSKTVYANLAGTTLVKVGDVVTKGQVIGKVGKTAIAESEEGPHLHFEYIVKGQNVDPEKYLEAVIKSSSASQK